MSKFSKGKKRKDPAITTAALPDIVFMLLFFFMVTTKPKKDSSFVILKEPKAYTTEELRKNDKSILYWIGRPKNVALGETYRVWVDDALVEKQGQITSYLFELKQKEEYATVWSTEVINLFKVDEGAPMGLVRDVQEELRDPSVEALRVQYSIKEIK